MIIEVRHFGGIAPKVAPHLLRDGQAQVNVNAIPVDGNLRGVGVPQEIQLLEQETRSLFVAEGRVFGWKEQGVTAAHAPSGTAPRRFVGGAERMGAVVWERIDGEDFAPPPQQFALGMPAPKEQPDDPKFTATAGGTDIADPNGTNFFGVSFYCLWRGIAYESNILTLRVGETAAGAAALAYDATDNLNSTPYTDSKTIAGGFEISLDGQHYLREGERCFVGDDEGTVIGDGAGDHSRKIQVRLDNPAHTPHPPVGFALKPRPERLLSLGRVSGPEQFWFSTDPEQFYIRMIGTDVEYDGYEIKLKPISTARDDETERTVGGDYDGTAATESAQYIPDGGTLSGGSYLIEAKGQSSATNLNFRKVIVVGPPILFGGAAARARAFTRGGKLLLR